MLTRADHHVQLTCADSRTMFCCANSALGEGIVLAAARGRGSLLPLLPLLPAVRLPPRLCAWPGRGRRINGQHILVSRSVIGCADQCASSAIRSHAAGCIPTSCGGSWTRRPLTRRRHLRGSATVRSTRVSCCLCGRSLAEPKASRQRGIHGGRRSQDGWRHLERGVSLGPAVRIDRYSLELAVLGFPAN